MSFAAITVESLSKAYRIGLKDEMHDTIVGAATSWLRAPFRNFRRLNRLDTFVDCKDSDDIIWALRDVSFEVRDGEVMGIIGRNGAGKSTLLKILSRITDPTRGKATILGRISSLLEVGTGFHPELSGRENIYMNGTILGMTKREIDRKFDEIVDFSGVEKFLDTPIKRYSSGMKVRLAFSVAAHLEPEILVIDEVLAVGDAEFQRKCLGKMQDVAQGGRTVLFVSHQMDAILKLCHRVMTMRGGVNSEPQSPDQAVAAYLDEEVVSSQPLAERERFQSRPRLPVFSKLVINGDDDARQVISTGASLTAEILLSDINDLRSPECAIAIVDKTGKRISLFHTWYHSRLSIGRKGSAWLRCIIPQVPLSPGIYYIDLIVADGREIVERVERACELQVVFSDYLGTGTLPTERQGCVVLPCDWTFMSDAE